MVATLYLKMRFLGDLPLIHQGKAKIWIPGPTPDLVNQNLCGGREGWVALKNLTLEISPDDIHI